MRHGFFAEILHYCFVFNLQPMTRTILITISLLSLCFHLSAQGTSKSLLWSLEGDNIKTSYIFGTIHLLPQKDFVLADKVDSVFNLCEELMLELDLDDPNLEQKMLQGIHMLNGLKIDSLTNELEYATLDSALQVVNPQMSLKSVETWKPFMLSTVLLPSYLDENPASFELALFERAMVYGRPIVGIERVEEQLAIFDSIPYRKQVEDILKMISEQSNTSDVLDTLISLYKEEEMENITRFMFDYYRNDSLMMEYLLYQRNEKWIPRILEQAEEKVSLIAVGAGHLGGERGILSLLRKRGYILKPVL